MHLGFVFLWFLQGQGLEPTLENSKSPAGEWVTEIVCTEERGCCGIAPCTFVCIYNCQEQRISQKVFRENGVWDFVACVIATGHITANQEFLPLDQKWKKTPKHCRLSYFKQSLKV